MKKNKINLLVLSLVLVVAMVGCSPANTKMRNMSTQTRLPNDVNNGWMNNNPLNANDRLNTNLNNGMIRNNNLNNGMMGNNNNLNNGMVRDDTNLNSGIMNNTNLSTNVNNLGTRANAIAKRVAALPEVNSASVLINGNTAIVGCDLKNNTSNTISSNLRQKIDAAVKVADKDIKNISITADPSIHTRIKTMSTKVNNGNPITGFTTEIQDILRRITAPIR